VEVVLDILVWILRLVPMTLLFFVPAMIGTVIWREKDAGYRLQALLWFVVGFALLTVVHIVFTSTSAPQVAATVGFSIIEIIAALVLAHLTVYRLSDPPGALE
jgi:D-alanyl-lipoteichoic acid acyltransferase DltB (MBOAT superfamily)